MDDLISRQDLIVALVFAEETGEMMTKDIRKVLEVIKRMPTRLEKQNKWILVSERLPEVKQEVLYSTDTGRVRQGQYEDSYSLNRWYSYELKRLEKNTDVLAWMPLPEPYRGERTEE